MTLTPETETQLGAVAMQRGLPPEAVLNADEARRVAEEIELTDAVAGLHSETAEIAVGG